MPTRRQAMIGLVGAVVVGGAAVVELGASRRERLLHRLGLATSPDLTPVPSGTALVSGTFSSTYVQRPVGWTISVPPKIAGVVYCLHGRGDDHRFAFDQIRLHDFVAAAGADLAVAAVDGGADSYWHRRADGTDSMAMLLNEFIPMVEHRLGPSARAILQAATR